VSDSAAFVELRGLTKRYGAKVAVAPIDVTVRSGEFVSLLGPSGSGKTTVLRMMAGLVRPDGGSIRIADEVVFDRGRSVPPERRGIGMVFQDFALWPHMSVNQNVGFGLRLRRLARRAVQARVDEMLELTDLGGLGDRFPHQLSGGQQQRVALARALATAPKLILLDEPLSSLDAGLRESMRQEILRIVRATRTTVVNVTHDQDEAMVLSDRILVLRDGILQQEGTPDELYRRPRSAFVGRFMGPANVIPGRLVSSEDGLAVVAHDGQNLRGRLGDTLRVEASVTLMCRVEDVGVHTAQPNGGTNALPAVVTGAWFKGGRWQVRMKAGSGADLHATAEADPGLGRELWASMPPDRCWIVEAEPAERSR
jgi:ABC-type Fe3+/spermidine/putrescine transport system ATPase subunit